MKKKIVLGVLLAVIIVAAIGTYMYRHRFDKYEQSQEEQTAGIKAIGKDSRFLVTYFSWPSPDYPDLDATSGASNVVKDGHLYGNTEYVADILSKKLNADLFRIETVRSYPTQPKALLDETKVENTSHMKPELKSRVDNFSDYDVIFVGYP
ncbi:MAG: flavodoxin, partial [Prevotella sp.]|nr:flavodoxin [Prevotella sp.]